MTYRSFGAAVALIAFASLPAAAAEFSAAEKAAIFKAAGFKAKGGQYIRCEEDPPTASSMTGFIETEDLNKDGKPEAWVRESSTFCYGNTAEAFVLLTQGADGAWKIILDEVGMALPKTTKHNGWPDIEVGGPGMGPFPVFKFNGTKYVR